MKGTKKIKTKKERALQALKGKIWRITIEIPNFFPAKSELWDRPAIKQITLTTEQAIAEFGRDDFLIIATGGSLNVFATPIVTLEK